MDLERQQKIAQHAQKGMEYLEHAVGLYTDEEQYQRGRPPTHEEMEMLVAGWLSALATVKRDIEARLVAQGGYVQYITAPPPDVQAQQEQLERWFDLPAKDEPDDHGNGPGNENGRGRDEANPQGEADAQTD
jgi:hypothetical protein